MKLKSLVIVGLLALGTSCTNQGNVFSISKFYPLGEGCDDEAEREVRIVANGFLDVAAGNPQYFVGFEIIGGELVQQRAVTIGGTTVEAANRNRPIITRQVITYKLSKRIPGAPTSFETAFHAPFSDNGELFGAIQLISPEMGQALFDTLAPVDNIADDFVDLTVELEFRGEYSATRSTFNTGIATLPLRVYRSTAPTTCGTDGFQRFPYSVATQSVTDFCAYVGQSYTQSAQPPKPACCDASGTMPSNPDKKGC